MLYPKTSSWKILMDFSLFLKQDTCRAAFACKTKQMYFLDIQIIPIKCSVDTVQSVFVKLLT